MDKKIVNSKLVIFCGVALTICLGVTYIPFDKILIEQGEREKVKVETPINNSLQQLDVPNINDLVNMSNTLDKSYQYSLEEILTAKDKNIYATYDDVDYHNPYYQKYVYSKENPTQINKINDYPTSMYGSVANKNDFECSFPTGEKETSETEDKDKETETTNEVIYWTENGSIYHKTNTCNTLKDIDETKIKKGEMKDKAEMKPCETCYENK